MRVITILEFGVLFMSRQRVHASYVLYHSGSAKDAQRVTIVFMLSALGSLVIATHGASCKEYGTIFQMVSLMVVGRLGGAQATMVLFRDIGGLGGLFALVQLSSSFSGGVVTLLFYVIGRVIMFGIGGFQGAFYNDLALFIVLGIS